ncbi:MAG: hypothetical protein ACFFC7_00140 [Candidatus Hermodarchaeota archaeon]
MTNVQPLRDAPRLIAYEVRDLVTRTLHVPFNIICFRTVKQSLDKHPSYSLRKYSSRTQQLKKFLKDNTSALTVKEFWQGVRNVYSLPTPTEVVHQVQALVTRILGVPPKDICCSTVKTCFRPASSIHPGLISVTFEADQTVLERLRQSPKHSRILAGSI